jgi:probable rRNA maturation factor
VFSWQEMEKLAGVNNVVVFRKPVARLNEVALARFVTRACQRAKLRRKVDILVTSSQELRSLNRRFRGKDSPTDVLSFPVGAGVAEDYAGDVAISAEIAARNAALLGHTPAEEIKILALHGVLHLAGYDHESDKGEMARKEASLRRSLGLPVGLIERSAEPLGLSGKLVQKTRRKTAPQAASKLKR